MDCSPSILLLLLASLAGLPATADPVRFATFNASMNRNAAGDLTRALRGAGDPQIMAVAEIIQRVDPDVILINEFDYAPENADLFRRTYLKRAQRASGRGGARGIEFPHAFTAPSNTGVDTGFDLDKDGQRGGPGDAQGYGAFEGQYGMLVLSKHPILTDEVRTFRDFLWHDMPGARFPEDPLDADDNGRTDAFYRPGEARVIRLSSKSHWDLPIDIDGTVVHFLVSHPTPPIFDGPEDRNGLRNADEIRFWADYVNDADYVYDDSGATGGLPPQTRFVIAGDLNADPFDGDSAHGAAMQLLEHPLIAASATDPALVPAGPGGTDQAAEQAGANASHEGDPAFDTADFGYAGAGRPDDPPGNLRVDYVLPSRFGLTYEDGGVMWPESSDPLFRLTSYPTSDHRLVWIDVTVVTD